MVKKKLNKMLIQSAHILSVNDAKLKPLDLKNFNDQIPN